MKNWKTTLAGVGSIIAGVALIAKGQTEAGIGLITAGLVGIGAADSKKEK
jgi:hypothetical protein